MTPEQARADERKAIVAWFKKRMNEADFYWDISDVEKVSDEIERGEHMKGQG